MNYKVLADPDKVNRDDWLNFILKNPGGNFFQSPEYYTFYYSLPGYEPFFIICTDNNDNICGLLVGVIQKERGYFSSKLTSRCIIYGGPLVSDTNILVTELLLKELIKKVKKKSIYIEFRNLFDLSESKKLFKEYGFKFQEHYNFILNIENVEENLKKLNKTRRWEIKKGLNSGAEIVEANNIVEIKEFYSLLVNLYRKKIKKPLPNFSFFERFYQSNLGKFFIVKNKEKVIGGTMCPVFQNKIYEWYECSEDQNYKHNYPGTLATWAPIEYAAKHRLKHFDFLGAGSPDNDYGVREFKSKFGGELVNYGRFLKINKPLLYKIGKTVLNILQKL